MVDCNATITKVTTALSNIQKEIQDLSGGPFEFYVQKVKEYAEDLFLFSKFKVGDRVQLAETIDLERDDSRWCFRHILVKGEPGTITAVDWDHEGKYFWYYVKFDRQSYWSELTEQEELCYHSERIFNIKESRLESTNIPHPFAIVIKEPNE